MHGLLFRAYVQIIVVLAASCAGHLRISNSKSGEWSKMAVILNNSGASKTVDLQSGGWSLIADGSRAGLTSLGSSGSSYTVPAHGSAILVQGSYTPTVFHRILAQLVSGLEGLSATGLKNN